MEDLVIYGTGFLDVVKLVDAINRRQPTYRIKGFLNDLPAEQKKTFMGYPVLGGKEVIRRLAAEKDVVFCNNITSSVKNHKLIAGVLEAEGARVTSLIHPGVDMNHVLCGPGAIICEGCVIGANVRIGRFFTCRFRALITHDVTIGDFVFVGPAAACTGCTVLEDSCFIGAGAIVSTGARVGAGSVVGAGSLVLKDLPPGKLVFGSPARIVRDVGEDEKIA